MYDSLKEWMNLPAKIKPFVKRNGTGTKIYGEPFDIKCYAASKIQNVTDNTGAEVVSNTQLYVDGTENINVLDSVIFENSERSIKSIGTFYRNGKPDIKVVYL